MIRIESLLSARLFVAPQYFNGNIYFVSNLAGHLSLYRMRFGGSVPQPLLPNHIALQNPTLVQGQLYKIFPKLGKILISIDNDGDEVYKPHFVPLEGGFPEPILVDQFADFQVNILHADTENNIVYLWGASQKEAHSATYLANLNSFECTLIDSGRFGHIPIARQADHNRVVTIEAFGLGDQVLHLVDLAGQSRSVLYGVPLADRTPGERVPPNSIGLATFVNDDNGILCPCSIFDDKYGLAYIDFATPGVAQEVKIEGIAHVGVGEFEDVTHLYDDRFELTFNIDGCHWLYEGRYDAESLTMHLLHVICGDGALTGGVLKGHTYDRESDRFFLSFTTATMPTQLVSVGNDDRTEVTWHTAETILGLNQDWLSAGEDYPFESFDGLRISARLYMPAAELGFEGARPLIYYIHGGPQSQEHPDFGWFSMPLIQFLTLKGFAVFVPNVRGSTGYGFEYMNHVVRDWGGDDRLDHVHAVTHVLAQDERIDVSRAAVIGRSYGGYMTLTLASRHPELWTAAVDMFGPYDLLSFVDNVPETWKPYIAFMVGDREKDLDLLKERSPITYLDKLRCPMLVIQGQNDPRVVESESSGVVKMLREQGNHVDYLLFPDEGHDVLKYNNRVHCYNAITDFFVEQLKP